MPSAADHFRALLAEEGAPPPPVLDVLRARRILERTENVPFFAHSYTLIHNLDYGPTTTRDLLDFAYTHGLAGLCLHINDGDGSSVGRMTGAEREVFRRHIEGLGLRLHLEISSSERAELDRVTACARDLGVENIRLYARYEGPLSSVIERIYADMCYAAELANRHDLCIDYEQHEDLRASEIADILRRVGDPRINALFDYTNSLNAHEEPLEALAILAPYIRQVHIKGGRKVVEGRGWGQMGVPQGSAEDTLPGNRMLYELLMLGEDAPQVVCFALEQEVGYYAPPFRLEGEEADPHIQFRAPSETPLPEAKALPRHLLDEMRWAIQQIEWNRTLVARLREICMLAT
ncbi:MAG: TIM barrel protein [Devosia sp.]